MKLYKKVLIGFASLIALTFIVMAILVNIPGLNIGIIKTTSNTNSVKCENTDKRFCGALMSLGYVEDGHSMNPTMSINQTFNQYKIEPQIKDIVSFYCSKPECLSYKGTIMNGNLAKRLTLIRESDNAWWILGDNSETSFDSRYFGWILPSERSDVWVVDPRSIK